MEGGSKKVNMLTILTVLYLNNHVRDLAKVPEEHARLCVYMKYLLRSGLSNCFQIFADRSTFRGIIKNKATEVVHRLYDFNPTETFYNQQEEINYIASAIRKLIHRGWFLIGGLDEHVSPNIQYEDETILTKVHIGT